MRIGRPGAEHLGSLYPRAGVVTVSQALWNLGRNHRPIAGTSRGLQWFAVDPFLRRPRIGGQFAVDVLSLIAAP